MPPSGQPALTVTGQQEAIDRDPKGELVPGYRVLFTTPSGISGSIFVPRTAYTAANVKALLKAHVAELEAVQSFTGA